MNDEIKKEKVKLMSFANGEQAISRGQFGHNVTLIYDDVPPPDFILLEVTKEQADVLEEQAKVNKINFDTISADMTVITDTQTPIDTKESGIAS